MYLNAQYRYHCGEISYYLSTVTAFELRNMLKEQYTQCLFKKIKRIIN
jgi:hypothetical protein